MDKKLCPPTQWIVVRVAELELEQRSKHGQRHWWNRHKFLSNERLWCNAIIDYLELNNVR